MEDPASACRSPRRLWRIFPRPPRTSCFLIPSPSCGQVFAMRSQSAGYLVVTASDLGEAVDRLTEMPPDLLITRPFVNSMPGRTAADYLRSKQPGLPILIVAGFMDDDRIRVQNAVEEFYTFPNPFSRGELVAKVRDVLDAVRKNVAHIVVQVYARGDNVADSWPLSLPYLSTSASGVPEHMCERSRHRLPRQ